MFLALLAVMVTLASPLLGGCSRARRLRGWAAGRSSHASAAGASNEPVRSAPGYRRAAFPVFDIHTHLDPTATAPIVRLFDERGIRGAVNLSGGFGGSGLEETIAQQRETHERVLVFCNVPWQYAPHPRFVELAVETLEHCQRAGARGFKIPKSLGLAARNVEGQRLHVDDPRLDPIFEAAGRLRLPVLIHSGDPRAFFEPSTPQNERWEELQAHPAWSFYGSHNGMTFPTFDEIISEYERRVLRHPHTTFIGAHFGNCAEDPDRVERMLERAPNLYIDTAARVPEFGRHPAERMRRFFLRWQDRVLFGTDLGLGADASEWMLGSHGSEATTEADVERFFTATFRYFEGSEESAENPTPIQGRWPVHPVHLPANVLRKIYGANAARLLHLTWPPPAAPGPSS